MEQLRTRAHRTSRRPRQSLQNSRYSARYLILVYSKIPERFDPLEIQRLVAQEQAQCTIVRQLQADSTSSYLAFVDFAGKRFQTRNLQLFDIQDHHPKWLHVRSFPWKTLDTMTASGEMVWNGISRDKKTTALGEKPWPATKSSAQWEYLGSSSNEGDILGLCRKYIAAHDANASAVAELPQPRDCQEKTELSRVSDLWREGYRAGYSDGLSHHKERPQTNLIPQFDSESLKFLSEISHPSQQADHFGEEPISQDPVDEMLAMNHWSPGNLESLDWECSEFSATAFSSL